ncbi:ABC transporter substrate-binding protein [Bacillaceae bacterium]
MMKQAFWRRASVAAGLLAAMCALLFLAGCGPDKTAGRSEERTSPPAEENLTDRSRVLALPWPEIVEQARGSEVHFFMWGGDEGINRYIDEWVAPRLRDRYGITLKRYPMDAAEFINKLLTEKKAGVREGQIDIIWINGENFATAKDNGLLLGPITPKLPNFNRYVDGNSPDVRYDFGRETEGYEAPWGKVQFVFAYDAAKVADPPDSIPELVRWVKEHPGKFTYPAPPDFTGSAFIRHVLYDVAGGYEPFLEPFAAEKMERYGQELWRVLNEMEPYLWREGRTYPASLAQLNQLYRNGEVWLTMGYDEADASSRIARGEFPRTTRTFVLETGTLANTHFLAVPFNAPNPSGALVAIDYLLSPEAQLKKMELTYWGENMSLDINKLSAKERERARQIDRGPATLPEEVLAARRLPEIGADYVNWLERGWLEHVARK